MFYKTLLASMVLLLFLLVGCSETHYIIIQKTTTVLSPTNTTNETTPELPTVLSLQNIILTSLLGTNTTSENLSVSYTATNYSSVVTDWRKNGSSLAVLNMPFAINSSSTALDYSTNGNTGTVSGATWSSEREGSYSFDGVNDSIYFADVPEFNFSSTDAFSVAAWVYRDTDTNAFQHIIGKRNSTIVNEQNYEWQLRISVSSSIEYVSFLTSSGGTTNSLLAPANKWFFVAATFDNGVVNLYLNDTVQMNAATGRTIRNTNNIPLTIGMNTGGSQPLKGSISDVLIFDSALSADQIAAIYTAGLENESLETLPSSFTSVGDSWSVNVTATNNTHSISQMSNSLTIIA